MPLTTALSPQAGRGRAHHGPSAAVGRRVKSPRLRSLSPYNGERNRGRGTLAIGMALLLGSSAARLTFAAEDKRPAFGEPRPEATEADRKIFTDGLKQFSRAWDEHDGVGARFNEHS